MADASPPIPGTQSIARVAAILRAIARFGPAGVRLQDLARVVNLTRPTTHRILKGLTAEQLVAQDPASRRYRLGRLMFELGLATVERSALPEIWRPTLRRLSIITGDTIYLVMRSGLEAVCLDRLEGSYPIRTVTLDIGGRRPLGLGAGGLALLAELHPSDVENVITQYGPDLEMHGLTGEGLRAAVAAVRQSKFAHIVGRLTAGVSGIGMAIPNDSGAPFAAISIAAITERMTPARLAELKSLLQSELTALTGC
jgi:DNA-binding IclR family transcriptional regulator